MKYLGDAVIQQKSAFIRTVSEVLNRHSPRPVAFFGRNDTDSYTVVVEPSNSTEQFVPTIWELVPPGSIFTSYSGWVACRVLTTESDESWVGMEVIVPHATRGVYVEACYGLFTKQKAIDCLMSIKALPFSREYDDRGEITGIIRVPSNPERHRTETKLHSLIEAAISDLRNHQPLNFRVPSLGTQHEPNRCQSEPRLGNYALVGGTIAFVAGLALTIYIGGCGRR